MKCFQGLPRALRLGQVCPHGPQDQGSPLTRLWSSGNAGCPVRARPGALWAYSLAAVGVEDSTEEFHAHDGEGVVEDEQGEAQAGEEGQRDRVTGGQAGEPASAGSPAPQPRGADWWRGMPLARFADWDVPAGKGPHDSGLGQKKPAQVRTL